MFQDVSRAVTRSTSADCIVLVSSFAPAINHARKLAWDVLVEEAQVSESASVDWASRILRERGVDLVMRLPADVPLIETEDIDALLSIEMGARAAVMVPSLEGTGTNAIIRRPPDLFPSRFGPNSLALHKEEAARVGVECLIVSNERIALDIDEPQDLQLLAERVSGSETHSLIAELGLTAAPAREPGITQRRKGAELRRGKS